MGRSHKIHATIHERQAKHQSSILETTCKLNGISISILIDLGVIESFISPNDLLRSSLVATKQSNFEQVEMASRRIMCWFFSTWMHFGLGGMWYFYKSLCDFFGSL
jgi:hypothetical protein